MQLSDSDVEEIDRAAEKAPAKRRRRRKWHVLALVASVVVFLGGVTLRVLDPQPVRRRQHKMTQNDSKTQIDGDVYTHI